MLKPNESVEVDLETAMPRQRGKWTEQERRRIVADSRVAGASAQEVAQRHGVRAKLIVGMAAPRRRVPCKEASEVCGGQG